MKSEFQSRLLSLVAATLAITTTAGAVDYHWTGSTSSDFQTPGNWVENSWAQWSDYHFGSAVTNGTVSYNTGFGTGSIHLDSGLTTNVTIGGPQPVIMAKNWGTSGTITINSNSRDLTINTAYDSNGPVTWDVGESRQIIFTNSLSDWNGTASIVKQGAGTAILSGINTYTGGTTVSGGTLELSGATGGSGRILGPVTIHPDATLALSGGDGTGFGWTNAVTSLDIQGGRVTSMGTCHIWNMSGVSLTGGTLESNNGVSSASGPMLEWGNTPVTTNPSAQSSVIGGRIRIRYDSNPFITFNVADGGAAVDLDITAAITQSAGKCGLIKQGAGTLRLSGAVLLDGVITVEAGTLDVSSATLGPNLKINVSNKAFLKLPSTPVSNVIFVAGEKLAPGTWGSPGSVVAGTASNESPVFTGTTVATLTNTEPSARDRWKSMHYGMLVHYVWGGSGLETRRLDGSPTGSIDEVANGFDAQGFADDLDSAGVEYVIFTAWHSNFFSLFNSSAVVNNFGFQRNSSRDMIGEMVSAVKAKGIRVLLYANIGQVSGFYDNRWNDLMEDIFAEMLDRYDIDGFFMDENDPGGYMPWDFPRIARAIHLRKPDAVTIQNFYGNLYTWDGAVGESGPADWNLSNDVMWTANSSYAQVISQTWSAQVAKVPTPNFAAHRTAEGIYRGTVVAAGSRTEGGGIMWSAGPFVGNGTWFNSSTNQTEFVGRWESGVLEAMQGAGAYIAPVAESIKGVLPSNSWRPQGFIGNLEWGVATRKPDDSREYIHVLKPQATKTLKLPPPNDGKIFTNARLLPSNSPVTLVQTPGGVSLTLGTADNWNPLNTVIAMDVVAPGGRALTNNDSDAVTYQGSSWSLRKNRGFGEYNDDAHLATDNGDSLTFTFNGTDVEFLASRGPTRGMVEVFVDNVSQGTVDLQAPSTIYQSRVFAKNGLSRGMHTLRIVKQSGAELAVDAFTVSEWIDNTDPALNFGALSNYNNTQDTPNGVGYVAYGANWNYQTRYWTEYNGDIHWAQWNGSEATIHFTGTGIVWEGNSQGVVDFYLDGNFVKQTNMGALNGSNQIGYEVSGLPHGNHTLRFVKAGGVYVEFDNFRVYNEVNDQWTTDGGVETTPANEDFLLLTFNGQSADIVCNANPEGGTTAVTIDGNSIAANQYKGVHAAQSPFYSTLTAGLLENGSHTLRLTKKRGSRMNVDGVRIYRSYPSTALRWKGGTVSDFTHSPNWLDDSWEQWKVYLFDSSATTGDVSLNQFFGSGDLYLNHGLNHNVSIYGPNPLIMVSGLAQAWQIGAPTGTITLDPLSRDLTINTGYLSAGPVTWNVGQSRTLTLNGSLQDWQTTASIVKNGAGTAVLTGNNTHSSGTTINGGTLIAARSMQDHGTHTLGSGPLVINSGGTLRTTANWATGSEWNPASVAQITIHPGGTWSIEAVGMTVRNGLRLDGGAIIGTTSNPDWGALHLKSGISAGGNTVSSIAVDTALSGNQTFTVEAGSQLNHSGGIHNQYGTQSGLTKAGPGVFNLSGNNSYSGQTSINSGTLRVSPSGSLRFRPTTNGTTNAVSGNASGTLDFKGAISLDLTSTVPAIGNAWNLFNLGSLSVGSTLEPVSVTSTTLGTFTETTPGIWQLPVSGARWIFTEASGNLALAATDFDTWRNSIGLTGGPADDDDHDGLSNFTEYAFGLNPSSGVSPNAIISPLQLATGTFSYTRRRQALTGLTYSVWYSTNLADWTEDGTAVQGAPVSNGESETVPVTLTQNLLTNPRLFIRIEAK